MKRLRTILAIALSTGFCVFVGYQVLGAYSSDGTAYTAEFANVTGVVNNSPVMYNGMRVGDVTDIDLADSTGKTALMEVTIRDDLNVDLKEDAQLIIRMKSILGDMYVDLIPGKSSKPLKDHFQSTHRDVTLDRLIFGAGGLVAGLTDSEAVSTLLSEADRVLDASQDDALAVLENTAVLMEAITTRTDEINQIIVNLDSLSAMAGNNAGQIDNAVGGLDTVLRSTRNMLASNRAQLINASSFLQNVLDTADMTLLDEQLDLLPQYVELMDSSLNLLYAVVSHELPVFGYIIAVPPNAAETAYQTTRSIARNPVTRQLMLQILGSYMGMSF